ncbi:porin [Rhizobium rhizophilum]|uniref:Porin n=1 Tax=Rhizobium rhizophilum TaxID=1850373 RepID=A0ABY2QUL3_9HYPH|nr:porin [Rhizobium rhizophilum]THV14137.1 porin [Rhizobium rhizophilum]
MNIKSLLLGSAAALVAVSGAQAADAIVAAEPEPMEYVRVCDAFGTGYFYIPGTETCLKIGGEVRTQVLFDDGVTLDSSSDPDWSTGVRARLAFETRSDSEVGVIGSYIRLEGSVNNSAAGSVGVEQAYIDVGGFRVGNFLAFVDDFGLPGESDFFFSGAKFNSIRYVYAADAFTVGLALDHVAAEDDGLGAGAMASATFGAVTATLYGVYDFNAEEGAVAGTIAADLGPGTLTVAAAYTTGISAYTDPDATAVAGGLVWENNTAEWTVGASYGFQATEKLRLTASANYYGDFLIDSNVDAWSADLLAEYAVASGLTASASVQYYDVEDNGDDWTGFLRLTRSF